MGKSNIRRCAFSHCNKLHETKDIDIDQDDYLSRGNQYYHTDCAKISDDMRDIRDLWCQNIDEDVDFANLNRVMLDMIFNKGIKSDYIVFCVRYSISHGNKLRHPPGLRYIVQFDNYKNAYEMAKKKELESKKGNKNLRFEEEAMREIQKPKKPVSQPVTFGFDKILRGINE